MSDPAPSDRSLTFGGRLVLRLAEVIDFFVPEQCRANPDETRRARLVTHFGLQGTIFGIIYAAFYFAIGHRTGAEVIVVCSLLFAAAPWLLRRTGAVKLCGHLLVGTMAAGFTQLTLIEGGIHSHAVSWLASVPLCGLLILGIRPASVWAALCFLVGVTIAVLTLNGLELEPLYDRRWHNLIDAAGNVGIILFLFALGLVFEFSRSTAFDQMQESLDLFIASNEQLTHLNNEKTEFLGMAAHDLRNPLAGIIGFADLLGAHQDEKVARRGRSIGQAGKQMLELITDLLDANAIEEGRYASNMEPVDIRELVETSVDRHRSHSDRKQIPLTIVDGPACWAQADRKATLQILDNLVSNALKYSPSGSEITITVTTAGEQVHFAIKDEGPGISAEDQKKLFQKHMKLSARPTGGESSVGLGLAIVKRLAQAMKGDVSCESVLGEGARFMVRWQATRPPAEGRADASSRPMHRRSGVLTGSGRHLLGSAPDSRN